jgi:hypothetical protein
MVPPGSALGKVPWMQRLGQQKKAKGGGIGTHMAGMPCLITNEDLL